MAKETKKHSDSDLIDKLGGTSKAAKFFDVQPPSVSGWRKDGMPKSRMMYLRAMRPDLLGKASRNRRTAVKK